MKFETKYKIEDYIGKTFGNLTVQSVSEQRSRDGSIQWNFICKCGNLVIDTPYRVISGHKKSCGCLPRKKKGTKNKSNTNCYRVFPEQYIGKKRESLTVIDLVRSPEGGAAKLKCLCECGNITFIYPYQFDKGLVKSCGCARKGHSECHKGNTSRRTHGLSKHPLYKVWNDMVRRCYNPKEPAYRYYGAQGITVCDEWRMSPEKFIEWCSKTKPTEKNLTLDRINGTKGYCPDNCRWITQKEQTHNLKNNRFITINGETRCISEWCSKLKISPSSVYRRVKKGMSFEDALMQLKSVREGSGFNQAP